MLDNMVYAQVTTVENLPSAGLGRFKAATPFDARFSTPAEVIPDGQSREMTIREGDNWFRIIGTIEIATGWITRTEILESHRSGVRDVVPTDVPITTAATVEISNEFKIIEDYGTANVAGNAFKFIPLTGARGASGTDLFTVDPATILFCKTLLPAKKYDALLCDLVTGLAGATAKMGFCGISEDGSFGHSILETNVFNATTAEAGLNVVPLASNITLYRPTWGYFWFSATDAIVLQAYNRSQMIVMPGKIETCDNRSFTYNLLTAATTTQPNYPASPPTVVTSGYAKGLVMAARYI